MLFLNNVSKIYNSDSGNVDITLRIDEGQVYGIVGPNGAGKTTLIRQILGFIKPDVGEVILFGKNPFLNQKEIMKTSGYISGEISLYESLTGIQYLMMISKLKGNVDWDFIEKLVDFFSLDINKKIKKMSKGMKQKVAIISAVMHKPKLLVLDEPTSGLDIAASEQFKELLFRLKNDFRTTIIICSHIFDEIAKVCDKVGFLKDGRLIKEYDLKVAKIKEIEEELIQILKNKNVEDLF
ncbi:ABC transporter ATP-binding protein [Spiroplasma sp. BIUS-1]|uniref:ABC transporter ATP-binding protein n=1 Tax=Spiroplasma sp. BIUS-1 TaxID=216964 RepID=UPI00139761CD|nr:ABC transporter ATP-binding protein [Spiroplasma sp. BIUS-1]QHX37033.1 ABC transporter ATP-binding protein [Spiroplasma sp. BIUS-1]